MTPIGRVGAALGLSEGQVYTAATGLVVAVMLLALGLPAIRDAAPGAAVEAPRSLALPGSPAVAEVIRAPDPVAVVPDVLEPTGGGGSVGGLAAPPRSLGGGSASPADRTSPPTSTGPAPAASAADVPDTTAPPADAPEERRVREATYATASAPLLPPGEPGSRFPVALRVGAPDKQSYLRLAGTDPVLRLALSTQPGHQVGTVDGVRACRIVTPDWSLSEGAPLASAPEVDPVDCALGRPEPDGWAFDLSRIDVRNGVALVPVGPATGTFQIVFERRPA